MKEIISNKGISNSASFELDNYTVQGHMFDSQVKEVEALHEEVVYH